MAAYKVGANGGNAGCQWMVGSMYYNGQGVDVDYAQALPWIEKAAAQDEPKAVAQLGSMCFDGKGVTPSLRRARDYYERAIGLGCAQAVGNMQGLTRKIQAVTIHRSNRPALYHSCATPRFHTPLPIFPCTYRSPPSWTSGWSSTAQPGRT